MSEEVNVKSNETIRPVTVTSPWTDPNVKIEKTDSIAEYNLKKIEGKAKSLSSMNSYELADHISANRYELTEVFGVDTFKTMCRMLVYLYFFMQNNPAKEDIELCKKYFNIIEDLS